MLIAGIIILGSFAMLCLQAADLVRPDFPYFSHILLSALTAIFGYLFGNNARIPMQ